MELSQSSFHFKINSNYEYQIFWITYEVMKICPNVELTSTKVDNQFYMISILNSNLTLSDIKIILLENSIDYELVLTA
ncbi:hypothetical protein FIA58_006275 [Flavobacterium jejuense]|uniref:Uncharacterized protein n=1 Tax=Flavobacterium jejuense TaxID=1544455 RepID=A0ABX0INC5_9FLAO|nr:hypothetical protein [Flavobacterium jejuense]NHN25280.1 hypothetical protein [Flavobacterium jejuense]